MKLHKQELAMLNRQGFAVGIDEVGRGPLAGPVVAAAVVLAKNGIGNKLWREVADSKKLSDKKRRGLVVFIRQNVFDLGIGMATHEEVDELNVLNASLLAMRRAVKSLNKDYSEVFVDGRHEIPEITCRQIAVVRGDQLMLSVASASIVAKVMRDDLMKQYAQQFPGFGFDEHKGYPTEFHRKKLFEYGPCEIHRKSFETVRQHQR